CGDVSPDHAEQKLPTAICCENCTTIASVFSTFPVFEPLLTSCTLVIVGAVLTFNVSDFVALAPAASVTVMEGVNVPSAVGVPEMAPVAASIDSPGGIPVADHEYAGVPFDTETGVDGYGRLMVPLGNEFVLMLGAAWMTTV